MNKRGSHVGMIISFVIFITFIVFLYSVFKPAINTGENKKAILDDVEKGVLENISVNLTTATLQVKSGKNRANCVQFQGFLLGMSSNIPYYFDAIAKNEIDVVQPIYVGYYDLKIDRTDSNNLFFKVFFSPNFTALTTGKIVTSWFGAQTIVIPTCTILQQNVDYTVGSITMDSFPFESKINYLAGYYSNNYDKLKAELKITPGNDFGFDFTKSDGTAGASVGTPPKTANVFTDEVPIQYVDSKANILSGFINIKVW